jgi:DNA-binding NarL/FixJ family response regulator
MIKLMLVDDHAMMLEGLHSIFADCDDIEIIGEAGSAAELHEILEKTTPDVLTLDVKLPDANGISLMRELKESYPGCRVIVLTMYDHVRYALHALESGAAGFVLKGAPFEELLEAVRTVHRGKTYVSSEMAPKIAKQVRNTINKSTLDSLSQREFEVLTLLTSGLSVKETGTQMNISEKTVTTYRARLMEKLNLKSRAEMVRVALEAGLIE